MFLCIDKCVKKFCDETGQGKSTYHLRSYGQCESCMAVGPCVDCPPQHYRPRTKSKRKVKVA